MFLGMFNYISVELYCCQSRNLKCISNKQEPRTTLVIRRLIQQSSEPVDTLAKRFGVPGKQSRNGKPEMGLKMSLQHHYPKTLIEPKKKKTLDEIFSALERILGIYPMKIYLGRYGLSSPLELLDEKQKFS